MHETSSETVKTGSAMRMLLACGMLAPLLMMAFAVAAGLVTSGHDFMSQTLSQLGTGDAPSPLVMNTGFVLCGISLFGFSHGLCWRLGHCSTAGALRLLLMAAGTGIVLIGFVHADPTVPGGTTTLEGNLHNVFAGVAYLALLIGMIVFAMAVQRRREWRGFTQASWAVVMLNSVMLLALAMEWSEGIEGGLQLAFSGTSLLWLGAVSLQSLRLPRVVRAHESSQP